MRVLELFGGYGSQALALENLGIEFTSDLCDNDKYAIQAYNQLHGETFNYGDICTIDETKLPYYDLITYSSPCQDFSVAGKQAGGEKGSGTRSSLLWECERIIRAVKPKYLLMENVKALTSKKFMPLFQAWLRTLESLGYQNWWKVLNAKDYGIPQNRERVFVVSILGGGKYYFPNPIPLTKRLKDVLEQNVDEKYYLSYKICERFHYKKIGQDIVGSTLGEDCTRSGQRDLVYGTENKIGSLSATDYKQPKQILEPMALDEQNNYVRQDVCVGTLTTDGSSPKHNNRVIEPLCCASRKRDTEQQLEINKNGTTNAITTVSKDNYLIVPEATKQGYAKAYEGDSINFEQPNSKTRRGRVGHQMANTLTCHCNQGVVEPKVMQEPINLYPNSGNPQAGRVYNAQGISPAMDTCQGGNRMPKITEMYNPYNKSEIKDVAPTQTTFCASTSNSSAVLIKYNNYRIRKLTPRECWRLMGVRDYQFDKLHDISNSQLYKMAGNSIVVDVLMAIFKNLFMPNEQEQKGQLTLF